jgi:hypothetical protein
MRNLKPNGFIGRDLLKLNESTALDVKNHCIAFIIGGD